MRGASLRKAAPPGWTSEAAPLRATTVAAFAPDGGSAPPERRRDGSFAGGFRDLSLPGAAGIRLACGWCMAVEQKRAPGHYGALGVPPSARQRHIEVAFRQWGERFAAGLESAAAYGRAEAAYHVLATPESRARHDRQLGLLAHPAWRADGARDVRLSVRRAVRDLCRGRAERARPLLEQAVARVPEDPLARSYLALALVRTGGSLHEAARHGRYAVGRRPREPAFLFNLAEVYGAAGLRARALATRLRGWQAVATSVIGALRL